MASRPARRLAGRLASCAVAVALVAGPQASAATTGSGGRVLAAVQSVLDVRAGAVRSGDRAAFLATVDPRAPEAFRESQGRHFDGLVGLPLAGYSLQARLGDTGDLGHAVAERHRGAAVFLPETRQVYRFEGYDDRDAVDGLWLTFVERDGRWFVASDTDLEALGLETDRALWDFGPVTIHRTEHLLVLSHPDQAERARALGAMAEEAIGALGSAWDQPWSGRIPMVVPSSVGELERLLESTVDLDKFVAFVSYGVLRDEAWAPTAPRVFVQDARLSRMSRPAQVATLLHELVHAASAPLSGPLIPAWVHEGVAEWAATGRPLDERRPRGGDGRLPRDFEFATGAAESIVRSYRESRAAVSLLAAQRGAGAPSAFLRALGEARVAPGSPDHHVDAVLRRVAGTPLAELEAEWARSGR